MFNFFPTSAHFHLGGRYRFFIFSPPRKYFHVFIANEIGLLFLSLVLALSLLPSSMQTMTTKVERKTWLCCCLIFPSKSPGGHAIYHPNARVMLEMQNFTPVYEGTEDFSEPKVIGGTIEPLLTATFFRPCVQKIIQDSCLKPLYNGNFVLSPRWPL